MGATYPVGVESAPSPASLPFTVTAGDIPQVSLPLLPVGVLPANALSYNIYLSDSSADPNTATRYATGLTGTVVNLATAVTAGAVRAPITNISTVVPTVAATGGGTTGGQPRSGHLLRALHVRLPQRYRVASQPELGDIQCGGGRHPSSHHCRPCPPARSATTFTCRTPSATAGSAVRYASDITTSIYQLQNAGPVERREPVAQPRGDGRPDRAADRRRDNRRQPGAGHVLCYLHVHLCVRRRVVRQPGSRRRSRCRRGMSRRSCSLPLPNGATGYNIYLSDSSADPGSAVRYASTVTSSIFLLQNAAPDGGLSLPPTNPPRSCRPSTRPAAGRPAANCCRVHTTSSTRSLTRTAPSRSPARSRRNSPWPPARSRRSRCPTLPAGATGYNIYLSDDAANAGSLTLYASGCHDDHV